jgi:transposase InsO family protein
LPWRRYGRKALWPSLKYEEVLIKAYGTVGEARQGIGGWLTFYNDERPHQALRYHTPREVFEDAACVYVDNASASLRCAHALPTYTRAQQQQKGID